MLLPVTGSTSATRLSFAMLTATIEAGIAALGLALAATGDGFGSAEADAAGTGLGGSPGAGVITGVATASVGAGAAIGACTAGCSTASAVGVVSTTTVASPGTSGRLIRGSQPPCARA